MKRNLTGINLEADCGHVYMECTDGSSNKFYQVSVKPMSDPDKDTYAVVVNYGPIGKTGVTEWKIQDYPYFKAKATAEKVVSDKQKKGYQRVNSSAWAPVSTAAPAPQTPVAEPEVQVDPSLIYSMLGGDDPTLADDWI